MKRVLSIFFPNLAIEHWSKTSDFPPEIPVVLTLEGPHGPVIFAVTRAAAKRGARVGARLTDARALDPTLIPTCADPEGDSRLVKRLARWCGRWSPLVEVNGNGVTLDITGAAHLFGGEPSLLNDVQRRFALAGLTARAAIAPNPAAASALARYSPSICSVEQLEAKLAALHVGALQLDSETLRSLERLGLKTIGALIDVPRLALARRFRGSKNLLESLDTILGRKSAVLTAVATDLPPRAILRLEEPAIYAHASLEALDRLVPELVQQLEERNLGARRLTLAAYRVDGSVTLASVSTAIPSREPRHLRRLLNDKTSMLDPQFGFDAFTLTASWTEELAAAQDDLVEEPCRNRELARLIDRLTVKLGPRAVRRPERNESHIPERANRWAFAVSSLNDIAVSAQPSDAQSKDLSSSIRPQRLLDRAEAIDVIYATPEGMPRRFVWRRAVHDIARVEGPERIAPEWWRQPSTTRLRDYYRVEDSDGRRYWIFREGLIGDGRGGLPNWFIHGLFG